MTSDLAGSPVRMTVRAEEARARIRASAHFFACGPSPPLMGPDRVAMLAAIAEAGTLAMADCARLAHAETAPAAGMVGPALWG